MSGDEDVDAGDAIPVESNVFPKADRTSQLSRLGAKIAETRDGLVIHLRVPRIEDPQVWVKYRVVDPDEIEEARKNRATNSGTKGKGRAQPKRAKNWMTLANADLLVKACIGVYGAFPDEVDDEGNLVEYSLRPGDPHGELTTFDPDLAENLGLETTKAVEVCMGLFLTQLDLCSQANDLVAWSGASRQELEDEILGD